MKGPAPKRLEVTMDELKAIVARTAEGPLSEEDHAKLEAALETLGYLAQQLEAKGTSIERLRKILFGAKTEKTKQVFASGAAPGTSAGGASDSPGAGDAQAKADGRIKKKAKGHGRNGAAAYTGADKVVVPHDTLHSGQCCPSCKKGKLYARKDPKTLIRVVGQAPLHATIYLLACQRIQGQLRNSNPAFA